MHCKGCKCKPDWKTPEIYEELSLGYALQEWPSGYWRDILVGLMAEYYGFRAW